MQDVTVHHHTLTVPLVWDDDADTRTLEIHAAEVVREGGEQLPYLVFLQGGPGHEAPRALRAPSSPAWLETALAHYRVVMLDQRGTGASTPVGEWLLRDGTAAAVEYLTHLRADAIVRDAEALREYLGAATWTTLGQSFGGFTTLAYLTRAAESLERVYFTGGLSAVGASPDHVYSRTYDKTRVMVQRYYSRFPEHRDAMRRVVEMAAAGEIVLPGGEVLSVSRARSLGMLLGSDNGWQTLWGVLEQDPRTNGFRYDMAAALPFSPRNPLYYVLHESSYADGFATRWAAERVEPDDYREDPTLLTAEHVRRDWAVTVPEWRPWAEVAERLAEVPWPQLYDPRVIADSGVRGAAAVYVNDIYVPLEESLATAELLPGVATWVTSQFEHGGLRTGGVLERLIDLSDQRVVR